MKNQTIVFDTIAPYSEPVQIPELLSDIEAVIKRHVILKEQAAAALAVWELPFVTTLTIDYQRCNQCNCGVTKM